MGGGDSEANNRKAMKSIKEAKESGEIDDNLALLNALMWSILGKSFTGHLQTGGFGLVPVGSTL